MNFGHKIDNFGDMVIKVTENVQLGGKSQINLVLSKNIDIWPSYGQNSIQNTNYSIYGHTFITFYGYNSVIFRPIGLKCFVGTQGTIIYRMVRKNQYQHLYFGISTFWRENVRGRHAVTFRFWGSKVCQKVGPRWVLSGHKLSQNRLPKISDPGFPPPPPLNGIFSIMRCMSINYCSSGFYRITLFCTSAKSRFK